MNYLITQFISPLYQKHFELYIKGYNFFNVVNTSLVGGIRLEES